MRSGTTIGLISALMAACGFVSPAAADLVFTEDFTTATYEDTTNSTADWNTVDGELKLYPFSPSLAASLDTPGLPVDLAVDGEYAFVADQTSGIHVVDVSDPANPALLSTYDTPDRADGIFVSGDLVYVADRLTGLLILDVGDPTNPMLLGNYDTSGSATGVFVDGEHAFVADGVSGLQAIDVSDPANPVLLGFYDSPDFARSVFVDGDRAFLGDGTTGLVILDIEDPANPTPLGTYATPDPVLDVFVDGSHAFVADGLSGLLILDVSDPTTPTLAGSYDSPNYDRGVFVSGDRAYLADSFSGIQVLDVTDPTAPALLFAYDTIGSAHEVVVVGELAFVADDAAGGLRVVRVAHPAGPAVVGGLSLAGGNARGLFVRGDRAYLPDGLNGLEIVDIHDPANPVLEGTYDTPGFPSGIHVAGDYAFLADDSDGILVIDVSSPASPTLAGTYAPPGFGARDIFAAGDFAFVAAGLSGLASLYISSPTSPALAGTYDTPGFALDVDVTGGLAFVADGDAGVQVIDVSDPANPLFVGAYDTPGYTRRVFVTGDRAFVADGASGLHVLDVSDPSAPVLLGSYGNVTTVGDVFVAGDLAFLLDASVTQVVDVSDPTNPTSVGFLYTGGSGFEVVVRGEHAYLATDSSGLQVLQVFQSELDVSRNSGRSLSVNGSSPSIRRVRLSTTQTAGVSWEVSATGGSGWTTIMPNGLWYEFGGVSASLVWRSTHEWTYGVNPTVSDLSLEWLYSGAQISAIDDIPNDQGRQVRLEWRRSAYDFPYDPNQIVEYAVYRQIDTALVAPPKVEAGPASRGMSESALLHSRRMSSAGWDFITTVPVRVEDDYAVVVPTLADSTVVGGPYYTTFLVSALTATPGQFYDSAPDSGYSVDNLAPSAPTTLALAGGDLSWDVAPEPDFDYHTVYGSSTAEFDTTATLLGYAIDPSYNVSAAPYAYYHVTTTDQAGNESGSATLGDSAVDAPVVVPVPTRFAMAAPRPNPGRGVTTIAFDLPRDENVRLIVYGATGRRVRVLTDGRRTAGRHQFSWDGTDEDGRRSAAGIYFVRLDAGSDRATKRIVRLR